MSVLDPELRDSAIDYSKPLPRQSSYDMVPRNYAELMQAKQDKFKLALNKSLEKLSTKDQARMKELAEEVFIVNPPNAKYQKIRQPRIKFVDGKTYDIANLKYSELPAKFQTENKLSAEVAASAIEKQLIAGKPLDKAFIESASDNMHEEWLKRNKDWASEEQKLPFQKLSQVEADKDRIIIKRSIESYTKLEVKNRSSLLRNAIVKLSKSSKISSAIKGGAFGFGITALISAGLNINKPGKEIGANVLSDLTSTANTGCSEINDKFLNLDNDCRFNYEVNESVINFIESDESTQLNALKDPKLCSYYSTLYKKLHDTETTIPISKIQCENDKVVIKSVLNKGERKYNIELDEKSNIKEISGTGGDMYGVRYRFNNNEINQNDISTKEKLKTYNNIKRVVLDAKTCCKTQSDECFDKLVTGNTSFQKNKSPATKINGIQ